jgi:hypothetical protein
MTGVKTAGLHKMLKVVSPVPGETDRCNAPYLLMMQAARQEGLL